MDRLTDKFIKVLESVTHREQLSSARKFTELYIRKMPHMALSASELFYRISAKLNIDDEYRR